MYMIVSLQCIDNKNLGPWWSVYVIGGITEQLKIKVSDLAIR